MSDDDLIRRGDALWLTRGTRAQDDIRAIPARVVKLPPLHVTSSMSTSTAPPQDGWHLSFGKGGFPSVMHVRGGTAFCYHDLSEGLQAWASSALSPAAQPGADVAAQAREAALLADIARGPMQGELMEPWINRMKERAAAILRALEEEGR